MAATQRQSARKTMRSSVNWALLGLVIERPSYGLELAHRFERIYADVLELSSGSHVYMALDALVDRGMIEEVPGRDFGRQPRTRYRATQWGRQSFEDQLVREAVEQARRQELWVRQVAILAREPSVALRVLDRIEGDQLKRAGGVGAPGRGPSAGERGELLEALVAERERGAMAGMLSWLRYARAHIEAAAKRLT